MSSLPFPFRNGENTDRNIRFDLDFPLEVDDEYWIPSDPSQSAFKQPEGKPSIVSGFICMLKISQIKAHALRTIVSYSFHSSFKSILRMNSHSTALISRRSYSDWLVRTGRRRSLVSSTLLWTSGLNRFQSTVRLSLLDLLVRSSENLF